VEGLPGLAGIAAMIGRTMDLGDAVGAEVKTGELVSRGVAELRIRMLRG
jgi:hypothetical protein